MTNKELLYVEDEQFMKSCSTKASTQLQDPKLAACMAELEQQHCELYNKFLNLL